MRKYVPLLVVVAALFLVAPGMHVLAATDPCSGGCLDSANNLGVPQVDVDSTMSKVVTLLSVIAGIVSVFFLVYGGIKYITSSGNPQRIESAKQTLLYAVIGLIVSVLAGALIQFVVAKSP